MWCPVCRRAGSGASSRKADRGWSREGRVGATRKKAGWLASILTCFVFVFSFWGVSIESSILMPDGWCPFGGLRASEGRERRWHGCGLTTFWPPRSAQQSKPPNYHRLDSTYPPKKITHTHTKNKRGGGWPLKKTPGLELPRTSTEASGSPCPATWRRSSRAPGGTGRRWPPCRSWPTPTPTSWRTWRRPEPGIRSIVYVGVGFAMPKRAYNGR